ncbi:DUF962 domain-containing protein [Legionella israelensis]|uniref:DUF962 domain-containing protein n=1 Tax=Legionella israelensis TaxID=454 RepID=A0A0W0V4B2_9GAMM|nr:Mpo1-like protein [Legionella israelensis]KTD14956.1 transmembrane protein [Legionella israelensis]QBR83057.1 DUF962 domain-containing protein [Legionella israelensis]QBS09579.1 DUF962 domain-containing protein [Legionella israelensis]QDP71589.1 DUF962 domain-containing protein [Legionella israelensis]SCY23536.1 Uncharacterized membrane protein YGL010W [Legionella israelensis DSM 19235]
MINFIEHARLYAAYHQMPSSRYTHFASIPLILLSSMIFLSFFQIGITNVLYVDFATIGTLVLIIYSFMLNWKLALPLTPILIFLLWIATLFGYAGPTVTAVWAFIITFVLGWGLQFIGHMMEGKHPSIKDHIYEAIVIAPLFLMAELFFMANWLPELKNKIYVTEEPSDKRDSK